MIEFSKELLALADEAEAALANEFDYIKKISFENTARVMAAFAEHRVDAACFAPTTGYGYDDRGRDVLDRIFADVMGAEAAFVRHSIVNGTHALTIGLFGLLRPGDILFSLTGKPYDTLEEVIGIAGERGNGSLADYGVTYRDVEMIDGKTLDLDAIGAFLRSDEGERVKVCFLQRSKGYLNRRTLTVDEIGEATRFVKSIRHQRDGQHLLIPRDLAETAQNLGKDDTGISSGSPQGSGRHCLADGFHLCLAAQCRDLSDRGQNCHCHVRSGVTVGYRKYVQFIDPFFIGFQIPGACQKHSGEQDGINRSFTHSSPPVSVVSQ